MAPDHGLSKLLVKTHWSGGGSSFQWRIPVLGFGPITAWTLGTLSPNPWHLSLWTNSMTIEERDTISATSIYCAGG